MGDKTGIAWTSATWNPLRGCTKVSAGCTYCYAETMAARFAGPSQPYEGTIVDGRWSGKIRLVPEALAQPLRWRRPRRIFVNSMSDLFHPDVPDDYIAAVFGVMAMAWRHTFQVLTKRPERMAKWVSSVTTEQIAIGLRRYDVDFSLDEDQVVATMNYVNGWARWREMPDDGNPCNGTKSRWPLPNVWLGVSVEDQRTAEARIPLLLDAPAAMRFLSCEPLLGKVDLAYSAFNGADSFGTMPGLGWVIVGGESGPKSRPCGVGWIGRIVADCARAKVPCFVKQLGSEPLGCDTLNMRHPKGGDPAEWPEALRVREFP